MQITCFWIGKFKMTIKEALDILGITDKPTKAAVKRAFRGAALKHHPDVKGSDKAFMRAKAAYDLLVNLPKEELAKHSAPPSPVKPDGSYNPFDDPFYDQRVFFTPDNPAAEGFERSIRAKNCPHCHSLGFFTKNTSPGKGFLGRERRYCCCQWAD